MKTIARRARFLSAIVAIAAGCSSEASNPEGSSSSEAPKKKHELPELPPRDGARVTVLSDMSDPGPALERAEKLESLLDRTFPWLRPPEPGERTRVFLIDDEARFRNVARAHELPPGSASAFACREGEVVIRWKPEEWGQGPVEGWFQAPRSALVAEVLFRRRLEAAKGQKLERTWLEDGCARYFSERAARELGEAREASRRAGDDLLDVYLPLFLGADPVFAKTVLARGRETSIHGSEKSHAPAHARAVAYAVVRFLIEADGGKRAAWIEQGLDAATGKPELDEAWKARATELHDLEPRFERWLRDAVVDSLLETLRDEPIPAARWEARGALRVVAALDLNVDDDASPATRAEAVKHAHLEAQKLTTVRFVELYEPRLAEFRDHRRPGALERIVADARHDLDERSKGFGHPGIEENRGRIGKTFEERVRALSEPR